MENNTSPILLVDTYAQIYRGYHAVKGLSNADGVPTNAVFAMAKFLLRLDRHHKSEFGAFVSDKGKPAFRMELAPDYKANRPPMPDDLRVQTPVIKELIRAFGWPFVEHEGCEADDLLASISDAFVDRDVIIFSSDKDIAQIIDDRVTMLVPDHMGNMKKRGVAEVREKFGVAPGMIIDYLAFIGDSADNIPGVPGVGPKTAAALLNEFGSGEKVYASIDRIERESLRGKLADAKDTFFKNVELVRLKHTPPDGVAWSMENIRRSKPDIEKITSICAEMGLASIIREIGGDVPSGCVPASTKHREAPRAAAGPDACDADSLFSVPAETTAENSVPDDNAPSSSGGPMEQMSLF